MIIPLEANPSRSGVEINVLTLNKKLFDVAVADEKTSDIGVAGLLSVGLIFSAWGVNRSYKRVQIRDDWLAEMQMRKLEAEIAKLKREALEGKV